jgi:hypothetical protein
VKRWWGWGPDNAPRLRGISDAEHGVGKPLLELRVVHELLEQLGVVGDQADNDLLERGIVLDSSVLLGICQ